jgi:hypothetical protein
METRKIELTETELSIISNALKNYAQDLGNKLASNRPRWMTNNAWENCRKSNSEVLNLTSDLIEKLK